MKPAFLVEYEIPEMRTVIPRFRCRCGSVGWEVSAWRDADERPVWYLAAPDESLALNAVHAAGRTRRCDNVSASSARPVQQPAKTQVRP